MKCEIVHKDLIFFLEDDLEAEKYNEIKEHLESCQECRNFADMMSRSLKVIEKEKIVSEDNNFRELTLAKFRNRKATRLIPASRLLQYAAAAAVIVLGIFTGINIARVTSGYSPVNYSETAEEIYLINDMYQEPIESFFLLNINEDE